MVENNNCIPNMRCSKPALQTMCSTATVSGMEQSGKQSMEICKNYVGVACIDGSCPKANIDKYIKYGMDVIRKCEDCTYYNGCEDCVYPELIVR